MLLYMITFTTGGSILTMFDIVFPPFLIPGVVPGKFKFDREVPMESSEGAADFGCDVETGVGDVSGPAVVV